MRILPLLLLAAPPSLASAVLEPRQDPMLMGYPIYHNGPYPFLACTPSQGQTLIDLFDNIGDILTNQTIPTLSRNRLTAQDPNQDPFRVFFSTNDGADVAKVFQSIVDRPYVSNTGVLRRKPNIVCLNDEGAPPELEAFLPGCHTKDPPASFTPALAPGGFYSGTEIFVCPRFFTEFKPYPEAGLNCPTMDYAINTHQFKLHSDAVVNQFAIMVHELSHIYHPDPDIARHERYDLNQIINASPEYPMTAEAQLNNANNYGYYAVCVYLGCKNYPLPTPSGGRMRRSSNLEGIAHAFMRRQASGATINTTVPVPPVLDDFPLPLEQGVDAALVALQANLTALGY